MKNHRIIKVHTIVETNHKPSYIVLTEVRFNRETGFEDLTDRHTLSWTHAKTDNAGTQAAEYLTGLGINCVGVSNIQNARYIFSDTWADGNGFLTIKGGIEI